MTLLLAALLALQDPKPGGIADRVVLADRSELQGEVVSLDGSGVLRFREKEGGRVRDVPVEDVARILFSSEAVPRADRNAEQLRLSPGGTLTGRIVSLEGDRAVVETPAATFRVRRVDVKALILGPLSGPLPELREEAKDVLIREESRKEEGKEAPVKELVAEYGRLVSLGARVRFRVAPPPAAEGEAPGKEVEKEFDRAAVRHLYLHREGAPPETPAGWFAKVTFRNGDKLVGTIQSVLRDRVRLFSHLVGLVDVERRHLHSAAFVAQARMTVGNILVCDQNGVREFDGQGKEVWTFAQNTQYSWSARKLANGNVLIANTNYNQVVEVKPDGRSGGKVEWKIEQSNYPYDVARLDNGNTLVAEYYANRVVEYDAKGQVAWQGAVNYPISVQRLEDGNTLVSSNYQVVELDREGREKWRANLSGVRPWRAQRLENGNTLITDYQRGQVVEIDAESRVLWKMQNLSRPVQAIRLEDGNTLILEQGQNRVIEVDPSSPKKIVSEIKGLNYPQGMSTY